MSGNELAAFLRLDLATAMAAAGWWLPAAATVGIVAAGSLCLTRRATWGMPD